MVAAASLLPPPKPAADGMRFSSLSAAPSAHAPHSDLQQSRSAVDEIVRRRKRRVGTRE